MHQRLVVFLLIYVLILPSHLRAAQNSSENPAEAVTWLEKEADRIIRASKRTMDDGTAAFPPQVGIGYEAFWLRDYAYTLEGAAGSYSDKELIDACRLFVTASRRGRRGLDTGRSKFFTRPSRSTYIFEVAG